MKSPTPQHLRIGVRNKGCAGLSYHLEYVDKPGKFDEVVEQDGVKVVIDSKALFSIIGSEMDWQEDGLRYVCSVSPCLTVILTRRYPQCKVCVQESKYKGCVRLRGIIYRWLVTKHAIIGPWTVIFASSFTLYIYYRIRALIPAVTRSCLHVYL